MKSMIFNRLAGPALLCLFLTSCVTNSGNLGTDRSRSGGINSSQFPRTREVWGEYVRLAPPNHYKMNILTFPEPGRASTGSAGSKYFAVVRENLSMIESMDMAGVAPEVSAHIHKSTAFWRMVCRMQPALEREVLRMTGDLDARATQRAADVANSVDGDYVDRSTLGGIAGGFEMMRGLQGIEKLFDANVREHGREAWDVVNGDVQISKRLRISSQNIGSDQSHGQLYRALQERGML